jgi:hypothetical protein
MVSITTLSPDRMIEGFPVTRLQKIEGRPDYFKLKPLRAELKENAASITSLRGGGQNGHLGSILSVVSYARESPTPYVAPINPGIQPTYPNDAPTQYQIAESGRIHEEQLREWYEFECLQKALKKQIVSAVDAPFLRAIRVGTGLNNVSVLTILEHLFTTYGCLSEQQMIANNAEFRKEWDPDSSFELIIAQIDDCAEMAETAGVPYSPEQVLATAYTIVQKTGMFTNDLKEWKRLAAAARTWPAFKIFMVERQIEQLEHQVTARQGGYHSANALLERERENYNNAAEALANLATATASDRAALAALTNTVQQQNLQIKQKDDQIATLKKQLAAKGVTDLVAGQT